MVLMSTCVFASARDGYAVREIGDLVNNKKDMTPLFETIIDYIPAPEGDPDANTQVLISTIDYNGIATGFSGAQIVSPMWISAIPEIATIDPIFASATSTLFKPSNSYNLLMLTFFCLSGS